MRISTSQYFADSTNTMTELQSSILKLQQQASGGRVLTPADDPVAAARALDLSQSQSVNNQFATNRQNANTALSMTNSSLDNVITAITEMKSQGINAGNAAYSDSERSNIATSLKGTFQQLLGYANATDGLGNYLFAGYKSNTQPFVDNGVAGVAYNGDQGVQTLQVDNTRVMNTSVSGQSVFQGKGGDVFKTLNNMITVLSTPVTTAANNAEEAILVGKYNVGYGESITGIVSPPAALPATAAQIAASVAAATPAQLATADTVGTKARTDYSLAYATRVDYPVGSTGALNQALAHAGGVIDQALNNATTVQASVGANLNEMDALDAEGSARNIQYAASISKLMGTSVEDMTKTLSQLSQTQTALLTAQKAFTVTSGLSLLNFLK